MGKLVAAGGGDQRLDRLGLGLEFGDGGGLLQVEEVERVAAAVAKRLQETCQGSVQLGPRLSLVRLVICTAETPNVAS